MDEYNKNDLLNALLKAITIGFAIYFVFFILVPFDVTSEEKHPKTVNNQTKSKDFKTTDYTSDIDYGDDVSYGEYITAEQNTINKEEEPQEIEEEEEEEEEEEVEEEKVEKEYSNDEEVFRIVQKMPVYKGCENMKNRDAKTCSLGKIQSYISEVNYPQLAKVKNIEGEVYVSFIIDKQGRVSKVKILKGVDDLLDDVALDHIKKMPQFAKAGMQSGKKVLVEYRLPITFKLQ